MALRPGLLERLLGVPGAVFPPAPTPSASRAPLFSAKGRGLSAFDAGPLVKIPGIPRPTGRAACNPDVCYRIEIPRGSRGTTATLEKMADLIVEGSQEPALIQLARGVVRKCGSRDYICEGTAVMNYVHSRVTYRNDPPFAEFIQSPGWTYFIDGAGDCDDASVLVGTLNVCVGRATRLAAYALDPGNPTEYTHVLCEMGVRMPDGVRWYGQDTIVPSPTFGWSPPQNEWVMEPNYLVVLSP